MIADFLCGEVEKLQSCFARKPIDVVDAFFEHGERPHNEELLIHWRRR